MLVESRRRALACSGYLGVPDGAASQKMRAPRGPRTRCQTRPNNDPGWRADSYALAKMDRAAVAIVTADQRQSMRHQRRSACRP